MQCLHIWIIGDLIKDVNIHSAFPILSHSAVYDDASLSMYVFGGCTSASTTFNDLWRLDLTNRYRENNLFTSCFRLFCLIFQ